MEFIIVVMIVELDLGLKKPSTLSPINVKFIILVLMVYVELGLKKPATLPLTIVEQELRLTVYLDVDLR